MLRVIRLFAVALLSVSLLAACKSDEEKAAEFYGSAMEYIEEGDVDRALVELRNALRLDEFHEAAREAYADIMIERNDVGQGYAHLLRLVEQNPERGPARARLATLAIEMNNWDEARRHGDVAMRLLPEEPEVKAVEAALAYRDAVVGSDENAKAAAIEQARAVLEEDASQLAARRILIDHAITADEPESALEEVEKALQIRPDQLELHMIRARLLDRLGRTEALGEQLQAMYERFPENEDVGQALIRWYMSQRDYEGAESYLRDQAGADDTTPESHLSVVRFLASARGPEAAMEELERLIEVNGPGANSQLYRAALATMRFEQGERDGAITAIESVLEEAEPSDQTRRIKIMLARMLGATGNAVGARARVEEVLEEDPSQVEALKMRASWLIQSDQPEDAILDLRTALDQSPRDPEVLTLMAEAHLRNGSPELARERLALAAEVSGNRPEESLRYARFALQRNRPALAERVLDSARQVSPGNLDVLGLLSQIYLRSQRWPEAQEIAELLRGAEDNARAAEMARSIQSAILLGQEKVEDGLAMMQEAIEDPAGEDLDDLIRVLSAQISTGRIEEARAYLDALLEEHPAHLALRLFDANLKAIEGDLEGAEARYRAVLEENPEVEPAALQLIGLLLAQERVEEADAVLYSALDSMPGSRQLRLLKANRLEQADRIGEAIEVYEDLYKENSSDVIVANNLASLLSSWSDAPEALDRAEVIARRLNGMDVPAFKDTLGWIQYLKGDYTRAAENLEAAAEGLPEDPNVALHLGLAYAALGRKEEAREALERGLRLAGGRDLLQVPAARKALDTL